LTPPITEFRQNGMHRLIPSRYSETGTVLEDVATDETLLADAARLDATTNERIHGEFFGLAGISSFELIYGIPNAHIVRAAFLHPGPHGARFSDATRGAWYAAKAVDTSIAEISYHKARRLSEIFTRPFTRSNRQTSMRTVFSPNPCPSAMCRRKNSRRSCSRSRQTESFIRACDTKAEHAWRVFVRPSSISRAARSGMRFTSAQRRADIRRKFGLRLRRASATIVKHPSGAKAVCHFVRFAIRLKPSLFKKDFFGWLQSYTGWQASFFHHFRASGGR